MSKKKLLILGSSVGAEEIVKHAKSIGVHTIVVDFFDKELSPAKMAADEFWMDSLEDLDEIERKCREEKVDGIICGASEYCQDRVIELCNRLDLPCHCTKDAWRYNRNKADFKTACQEVGLPVATDYILSDALTDDELDRVQFPVIVKPVDRCGGNGITFAHNKDELIRSYRYARSFSDNPRIIVERKITGDEIAAYYVLADGEASLLCLCPTYFEPGDENCCYCAITTGNSYAEVFKNEINEAAKRLFKKIGAREGFAYIQMIRDSDDGRFYAIEMGYRLSGILNFMGTETINHFGVIKWMVECALGVRHTKDMLPVEFDSKEPWYVCSYVLWTRKEGVVAKAEGLESVLKELPIVDYHQYIRDLQPGKLIEKGRFVYTFVIVQDSLEEMCNVMKEINKRMSLRDTTGEEMLLHFADFKQLETGYCLSDISTS